MTFPLALRLEAKRVVMVGGGKVALEKGRALVEAGASLVTIAPEIHPDLAAISSGRVMRSFAPHDLDGAWLAYAAATPEVNREVRAACDARRIFLVSIDDVASCSAFGLARVRRGDVTIAIGTEGRAPALAALLARAIDRQIPQDLDAWVSLADRERASWKRDNVPIEERRRRLLDALKEIAS